MIFLSCFWQGRALPQAGDSGAGCGERLIDRGERGGQADQVRVLTASLQ